MKFVRHIMASEYYTGILSAWPVSDLTEHGAVGRGRRARSFKDHLRTPPLIRSDVPQKKPSPSGTWMNGVMTMTSTYWDIG